MSKGIPLLFLHFHLSVGTTSTGSFDTWSWVALNPGTDHVAEWASTSNTQEIDINKLHVFSNISELHSDVYVSMRFRNPHQLRLYLHFTLRMGEVSRVNGFKIDHMGSKFKAERVHQARAERLLERQRNDGFTSSGIIMIRTSPYLREFDVHVFLESRTSMTFDLNYKEKLQSLLSANWYEQQIRIYPYQLVEDFEMNVVIQRPRIGTLSDVDAYWDTFSASNTIQDPWGLQREPLTVRPWNGGSRINLSPIRSDMTNPRSWQSDLTVIFEWDSPEFGFDENSWTSHSDAAIHFESSDSYSSSVDIIIPGVTHEPHITDPVLTTSTESRTTSNMSLEEKYVSGSGWVGSGDDREDFITEKGSGVDLETDPPFIKDDTETDSFIQQSDTSSDEGDSSSSSLSSSSSEDSSIEHSSSDFDFTEDPTPQINIEKFIEKNHVHFKIYQKETSLEFKVPSSGMNSKVVSMFKRIMKKFFPKRKETSED